jgi:hypothetical protein
MSRMQRTKGATGERELSREIETALGVRLVRNLVQSRAGGHDLIVDPGATGPAADVLRCLAVEVKRLASVEPHDVARSWAQAVEQGDQAGLWPALAYRADRRAWRIRLPLAALWPDAFPLWTDPSMTVEVDLLGFAALVRESMIRARVDSSLKPMSHGSCLSTQADVISTQANITPDRYRL